MKYCKKLFALLAAALLCMALPVDKGRVAAWFAGISIPLMILTALIMLL